MKKSTSAALATALGLSLSACDPTESAQDQPTPVPTAEANPGMHAPIYGGPPMDRARPEPPVVQTRLGHVVRVKHKLKPGDRADVYSDAAHTKLLVPNTLVLHANKRSVELSLTLDEQSLIKKAGAVYVVLARPQSPN